MTEKVQMLFDRVLIRQDVNEGKTASGIIHTLKQEAMQTGEVLEVGPGMYDDHGNFVETTVKPGEKVVFTDLTNNKITLNGEEFIVLSEKEIFGILR